MTYKELVAWASAQNKTEKDILYVQARETASYIVDLSFEELVEEIQEGGWGPIRAEDFQILWDEEMDDEGRGYFIDNCKSSWAEK